MKIIFNLLVLMCLGIIFSACANQPKPFNINNRSVVFSDGQAYRVPYGATFKKIIGQKEVERFKYYGHNVKINDVIWTISDTSIVSDINVKQLPFALIFSIINDNPKEYKTLTLKQMKMQHENAIALNTNRTFYNKDMKTLLSYLSSVVDDDTTINEMHNMKDLKQNLYSFGSISFSHKYIEKGYAGIVRPLSKQEYQHYSSPEIQNRQIQYQNNIQNQRSLNNGMNVLTNQLNSMNKNNQSNHNNLMTNITNTRNNINSNNSRIINQHGQTKGYIKGSRIINNYGQTGGYIKDNRIINNFGQTNGYIRSY